MGVAGIGFAGAAGDRGVRYFNGAMKEIRGEDAPDAEEISSDEIALYITDQTTCGALKPMRYVAVQHQWYLWEGNRWRPDNMLAVFDVTRRGVRQHANVVVLAGGSVGPARSAALRQKNSLLTGRQCADVVRLLQADPRHATEASEFDADPMLLNSPSGLIDLRTGESRPAIPDDMVSKKTEVTPAGDSPLWENFLLQVTGNDREMVAFLQRYVGYCLSGSTREHALLFLWGTGANGKSVFINTLVWIFGDYAKTTPADMFVESKNDRHPTELAMLRGVRLAVAQEIDSGRAWALAKIKSYTGGEDLSARFMRGDFFEFAPQFKLLFAANHRPSIRNVDEAIRRRILLVPFAVTIPAKDRDQRLLEKLKEEAHGILQWAIEGCLEWQRQGLNAPASVRKATDDYIDAEDSLQLWVNERVELGLHVTDTAILYHDYKTWTERGGEHPHSIKRFSRELEDRGFVRGRKAGARNFTGLRLVPPPEPVARSAAEPNK